MTVQKLLEARGHPYDYAGTSAAQVDEELRQQLNSTRWRVVKVHHYEPPFDIVRRAFIIYTYRNPLDVMASLQRLPKFGRTPYKKRLRYPKKMSTEYFYMKKHPAILMLKYEDVYNDLPAAVDRIREYLGLPPMPEDVKRIAHEVDPVTVKAFTDSLHEDTADMKTQLRGKHISETKGEPGAWEDVLDEEQIAHTLKMYREMMLDAGYMTE